MKPIIKKDTNDEYHGNTEYVSSSVLKRYLKSSLKKKYEDENPSDPTPVMIIGTQYHSFLMEYETFEQEYYIFDTNDRPEPNKTMGSKLNIAWRDNLIASYGEEKIISKELLNHFKGAADRLKRTSPFAYYLLTGGENEVSHYLEYDGIKVKIRPDSLHLKKAVIADLKTTGDASHDKFMRHAADLHYHLSAGMYTILAEEVYKTGQVWKFYIIAQELTPPYDFNIFRYPHNMLQIGVYEFEQTLYEHKYCLETGRYDGYQEFANNKYGIHDLIIPNYMIKEINYNHF